MGSVLRKNIKENLSLMLDESESEEKIDLTSDSVLSNIRERFDQLYMLLCVSYLLANELYKITAPYRSLSVLLNLLIQSSIEGLRPSQFCHAERNRSMTLC